MEVITKVEFVEQAKAIVAHAKVEIKDDKEQCEMALELASNLWLAAAKKGQQFTLNYKRM